MSSMSAHADTTSAPGNDWDRIEADPEYRELRAMPVVPAS